MAVRVNMLSEMIRRLSDDALLVLANKVKSLSRRLNSELDSRHPNLYAEGARVTVWPVVVPVGQVPHTGNRVVGQIVSAGPGLQRRVHLDETPGASTDPEKRTIVANLGAGLIWPEGYDPDSETEEF